MYTADAAIITSIIKDIEVGSAGTRFFAARPRRRAPPAARCGDDGGAAGLLSNKVPSQIKLKVAVGQQAIHGDSHGNLNMYVLGTSNTQSHELGAFGGPFNPVFNTVSGLNHRLLSPHDMMCDFFDLHLVRHGFSGFVNPMTSKWACS